MQICSPDVRSDHTGTSQDICKRPGLGVRDTPDCLGNIWFRTALKATGGSSGRFRRSRSKKNTLVCAAVTYFLNGIVTVVQSSCY